MSKYFGLYVSLKKVSFLITTKPPTTIQHLNLQTSNLNGDHRRRGLAAISGSLNSLDGP